MKKAIWIFALVSLLFVGMLPTISNDAEGLWVQRTARITTSDDAQISEYFNTTNYGSQAYGVVLTMLPGEENRTFFRWSLSTLPSDITITKAVAKFYIQANQLNRSWAITIDRISSSWSEDSVTWDTKPSISGSIIVLSYHQHFDTDWIMEIDFTNVVKKWYDGTYSNYGLQFRGGAGMVYPMTMTTKEANYDEGDPELIVEYEYWDCDLEDQDEQHDKELEEIRRKLNELHTGEIIDPTEKLLPYPPGTREGLDVDYMVVDPYRELFMSSYSNPDAAASVTLPIAYDTSWSDVDMLIDQVYIGDFTGTLYINDTTDSTKILETTQSYSHFYVNATSEGHALTAEVTSGSVKVSRMARTHATFTFDWYVDPHTYEHRTVFSIDNDLTENWREIVIVVAGNPDYTIQSESVEVWDLDNNVELTTANYELTSSSIRMGLTYLNASTSRSFKIIYAPYQEGSDYQEPVGIYRWDEASSATLNNRVWMVDQVAINNPNSIDCSVGTRISIDMTSIPGTIEMIHVITSDGSYLTQGPPLGNKWYTFYGLEIPARSTVTVSVYVKTQSAALEAEDLRPIGLLMFTAFFILTVSALIGWIATKSDKKLHKWTDPARGATFLFGLLTAVGFVVAFWSYG